MSDNGQDPRAPAASDADLGRSQAIFIAVGLAIVLGGLWMLYGSEGPYHPEGSVTQSEVQLLEGS